LSYCLDGELAAWHNACRTDEAASGLFSQRYAHPPTAASSRLSCRACRPPCLARLEIPLPQGLGTSTAAEAKQYFANIHSHRKEFVWDGAWGA
jgi:hypothetical protein